MKALRNPSTKDLDFAISVAKQNEPSGLWKSTPTRILRDLARQHWDDWVTEQRTNKIEFTPCERDPQKTMNHLWKDKSVTPSLITLAKWGFDELLIPLLGWNWSCKGKIMYGHERVIRRATIRLMAIAFVVGIVLGILL